MAILSYIVSSNTRTILLLQGSQQIVKSKHFIFYFCIILFQLIIYINFFKLFIGIRSKKTGFQSNPECAIGHNKLAQMVPSFAEQCGFDIPRQHKAHGKYSLGIIMLSNSSVSEHVKMMSS